MAEIVSFPASNPIIADDAKPVINRQAKNARDELGVMRVTLTPPPAYLTTQKEGIRDDKHITR